MSGIRCALKTGAVAGALLTTSTVMGCSSSSSSLSRQASATRSSAPYSAAAPAASPSGGAATASSSQASEISAPYSPLSSAGSYGPGGNAPAQVVFTATEQPSPDALAAIVQVLKDRATHIPGKPVKVTASGEQITIDGIAAQVDAMKTLGAPVSVTFRPVLTAVTPIRVTSSVPSSAIPAQAESDFQSLYCPTQPPGMSAAADAIALGCSSDHKTKYLLGPSGVPGTDITSAQAAQGAAGWQVDISISSRGSQELSTLTASLAASGQQLAVLWDGTVASAGTVEQAIVGGQMQLSGLTGQDEAKHLATILNLAALPPKLETSEVTVVNPTG